MMPLMHYCALLSIFVCSAKTDPLFLFLSWQGLNRDKKKSRVFSIFSDRKPFLCVLDKYRMEDLLDKPSDRRPPAYICHEVPLMAAKLKGCFRYEGRG